MDKLFHVITVGSATIDAFAEVDSKYAKKGAYKFPVGDKILIKSLKFDVGGGGTNTAVAFARLGLHTSFMGKLGQGENSRRIMNLLKNEKIDLSLIYRENARTGYSVILDSKGKDRTILTYKGSNEDLKYSEINFERLSTEWFYFSSMTGESFVTMEKLADYASKNGIKIAFNPSEYIVSKGAKPLKGILEKLEILILNKEEAQLLIGKRKNKIELLLNEIRKLGPMMAVVTDGEKGAAASDGEYYYYVKGHKVKVVETTGAGDAFASSFVAGMMKTNDVEFAMQLGIANAESVIQHYGAKNILMKMGDAIRAIKKSPAKFKRKRIKQKKK